MKLLILMIPLVLSGCMTVQEREAADDNVCRTARD
jgi:uncharacterized protein YceK